MTRITRVAWPTTNQFSRRYYIDHAARLSSNRMLSVVAHASVVVVNLIRAALRRDWVGKRRGSSYRNASGVPSTAIQTVSETTVVPIVVSGHFVIHVTLHAAWARGETGVLYLGEVNVVVAGSVVAPGTGVLDDLVELVRERLVCHSTTGSVHWPVIVGVWLNQFLTVDWAGVVNRYSRTQRKLCRRHFLLC